MSEGCSLVIVLGRTNHLKPSGLVDSVIVDLEAAGHIVRRFERTDQWLDVRFEHSWAAPVCRRHPVVGRPLKRLAKSLIVMGRPSRWDYLLGFRTGHPAGLPRCDRRRLRRMLRTARGAGVCLLAHSAGSIAAVLLAASEPAVTRLVCFGYPFRHPTRPEEPHRTIHLPAVSQPFLIIQGDGDEYGTAEDARRYELSDSTVVVAVKTGHDYGCLDPADYQACRNQVLEFVSGRVAQSVRQE